jgi:hypothetical protein
MSEVDGLTARQRLALTALQEAPEWREGWIRPGNVARALGDRRNSAAVNTLNALVRRGLAEWSLESLVLGYRAHKPAATCGESVYRPAQTANRLADPTTPNS